ncbi:MAG TPA: hypothetical protein VJI46_05665 [Candidatus Nanoarchaeia archaeon]|nr:hypothetical protein [Candidatus Nanoarchaeia archaeon]
MPFDKGVPTPKAYIRYKGVWNMQELYEAMNNWFRDRKYKVYEKSFKHKAPSPFGIERQYEWEAFQPFEDYMRSFVRVYMHTYDAQDIEVDVGGKKKVFTKGRIWIEIKLEVEFDYEKRWNESSFYRHMKDFYNKYVIRNRWMQGFSPKYRTELYKLHHVLQSALDMQTAEFEHFQVPGGHYMTA